MKNDERMVGNIGELNRSRLQTLKDRLVQKHQNTLVDRLADKIDRNYDAFLINGNMSYPEIHCILTGQRKSIKDVTDRKYFLRCAREIISQGLYEEDENGNILFRESDLE